MQVEATFWQTNWHFIFLGLAVIFGSVSCYLWWRNKPLEIPLHSDLSSPNNRSQAIQSVRVKSLPTMIDMSKPHRSLTLHQVLKEKRTAKLVVQATPANLSTAEPIPIHTLPFTLGRTDCDLTIKEPCISRQHAKIVEHGGRLYLVDLNSSNFTFVSGSQIEPGKPTPLQSNMTIGLGRRTTLKFVI